jgi:hypothetical protein
VKAINRGRLKVQAGKTRQAGIAGKKEANAQSEKRKNHLILGYR